MEPKYTFNIKYLDVSKLAGLLGYDSEGSTFDTAVDIRLLDGDAEFARMYRAKLGAITVYDDSSGLWGRHVFVSDMLQECGIELAVDFNPLT